MIFFFLSLFFPAMASGQVYHTQKELVASYIDSTVNEDLEGAVLGLLAIGPEGDTIAAFNPSTLLIPASNMKLVTTGLALDALGSSHVYETGIAYSGEISGGTLHGDLYITGGGDPTLASDDSIAATLPELFGRWTEMLEDAGIMATDPLTVIVNPNLAKAREELAKIAAEDYEVSYQLIKQLDKKVARPVLMMANIYKRYFDIMQNRGWEIISPKPQLSKIKKLSLALRAFFFK